MTTRFNRRSVLRGMVNGTAIGVSLPLLDMFLNGNADALATGAPLPTRFASFFWGLGLTPTRWEPKTAGKGYATPPQLAFLEGKMKDRATVFEGFTVKLNGRPSHPHWTGMAAIMTGQCPNRVNQFDGLASFDTLISDVNGKGTRFRSVECTPFRSAVTSYSSRGQDSFSTSDDSPLQLYKRLFGEGFHDPNAADWKPDTRTMIKRSVLSSVKDQRDALMAQAGASDKARLDQYFTSVREVENKMAAELSRALGLVDAAFVQRLTRVIERAGLPTRGAVIDAQDNAGRYLQLMRVDKKAESGEIRFVLIDGPGRATVRGAPDALVRQVIDRCCA